MKMKNFGADDRVSTHFGRALAANAQALIRFDAMTPEQKKRVLDRVRGLKTMEETQDFVNSLVGWQEGHPPYQL